MALRKAYFPLIICVYLWGCFQTEPPVRPHNLDRLYAKVALPEVVYQDALVSNGDLSLHFESSKHARLSEKDAPSKDSCCALAKPLACCQDIWFDLYYEDFDATLNFTYKSIDNEDIAAGLAGDDALSDYINLNNGKAEVLDEKKGTSPKGYFFKHVSYANAGEPERFYLVDTLDQNFLQGSLIFNTVGQVPDSLTPYVSFIRGDIDRFLSTLSFQ